MDVLAEHQRVVDREARDQPAQRPRGKGTRYAGAERRDDLRGVLGEHLPYAGGDVAYGLGVQERGRNRVGFLRGALSALGRLRQVPGDTVCADSLRGRLPGTRQVRTHAVDAGGELAPSAAVGLVAQLTLAGVHLRVELLVGEVRVELGPEPAQEVGVRPVIVCGILLAYLVEQEHRAPPYVGSLRARPRRVRGFLASAAGSGAPRVGAFGSVAPGAGAMPFWPNQFPGP